MVLTAAPSAGQHPVGLQNRPPFIGQHPVGLPNSPPFAGQHPVGPQNSPPFVGQHPVGPRNRPPFAGQHPVEVKKAPRFALLRAARRKRRSVFHRSGLRGEKGGLFFTVPGCAVKKAVCFSPFLAARSKTEPPFTPPNSWGDADGGRLEVYPIGRWAYRASASRSGTWRLA